MAGLTEEQRYFLKFMRKYLDYDADKIRAHSSMINRSTNRPFQKRAINEWIKRLETTGDVYLIPKPGRPRTLSINEERLLMQKIRDNPKLRYRKIRAMGFNQVGVRSINQYGLRNKYRK